VLPKNGIDACRKAGTASLFEVKRNGIRTPPPSFLVLRPSPACLPACLPAILAMPLLCVTRARSAD
jgi:hypothetical protein